MALRKTIAASLAVVFHLDLSHLYLLASFHSAHDRPLCLRCAHSAGIHDAFRLVRLGLGVGTLAAALDLAASLGTSGRDFRVPHRDRRRQHWEYGTLRCREWASGSVGRWDLGRAHVCRLSLLGLLRWERFGGHCEPAIAKLERDGV